MIRDGQESQCHTSIAQPGTVTKSVTPSRLSSHPLAGTVTPVQGVAVSPVAVSCSLRAEGGRVYEVREDRAAAVPRTGPVGSSVGTPHYLLVPAADCAVGSGLGRQV